MDGPARRGTCGDAQDNNGLSLPVRRREDHGAEAEERTRHGTFADLFARPAQTQFEDLRAVAVADGGKDQPDRLADRGAARSRDAGERDRRVRRNRVRETVRHGAGGLPADGTVFADDVGGHAEEGRLGRVAVGHDSAREDGGGAGDISQELRSQPPGAGFGECERLVAFAEQMQDLVGKRVGVVGKKFVGEELLHGLDRGLHDFGRFGRQKQADELRRGTVGDRKHGVEPRDDREHALLDDVFAESGDVEFPCEREVLKRLLQERHDRGIHHGTEFVRRSREHDDGAAGEFVGLRGADDKPGSGAAVVLKDLRAVRHERLVEDAGRDLLARMTHLPMLHNVERGAAVLLQAHAAAFGDVLLRHVVGRGAEPAAGNDDVGTGEGELQRGEDVGAAVGDLDGGNRDDTERKQADADGGKVCVDDGAFQELVADADDGDFFTHGKSL